MSDSNTPAITENDREAFRLEAVNTLSYGKTTDAKVAAELAERHKITLEQADQIVAEASEVRARTAERMQDAPKPKIIRMAHIASLAEFAAVDEPGADALLGDQENALIPEDSDVMFYGNGGAGKTTLTVDLGFHLAAGDAWLGIPVARAARVLLVENEGPRPLFRKKLDRKVKAWKGSPLEDRLGVLDEPWGEFDFADEGWRDTLAAAIREQQIDVLIAGPVTRLGMNEAGTLQQVRDFLKLVQAVRRKAGRRVAVILAHHENKGGTVSGAWEGSGDTLLHVEARGNGSTDLEVQKARWSPEHHGAKLKLAWAAGEGFTVKDERDYAADIVRLLDDGEPRTLDMIRASRESKQPGIGASRKNVEDTLDQRADLFVAVPGADIARSPKATFYKLKLGL
jgi:hypothetical protein